MLKPVVYPYKMGSKSAKTLARALDTLRVYPNKHYKPKSNHLIINWGNSRFPMWDYMRWGKFLNRPHHVNTAANKLLSFRAFTTNLISCPLWTKETSIAQQWIDDGYRVFGRQTLTGHSGEGILIFNQGDEVTPCPLYTREVKKDKEYRVHVFNGKVIDYQQKKKKLNFEGESVNGIRNYANGWVYARNDVVLSEEVREEAIKAVKALGLDFGAVDVCTVKGGGVCVFEVNTACGLEGTTITKYVDAIKEMCYA